MLQRSESTQEILARVEAAIAQFEARPDRIRCSALLEALYRQREQLAAKRPGLERDRVGASPV